MAAILDYAEPNNTFNALPGSSLTSAVSFLSTRCFYCF